MPDIVKDESDNAVKHKSHDIVKYKSTGDKLICSFAGRLDSVVAEIIEDDVFDHVIRNRCTTIFDFKDVEYVSSAFLRVSIKAARATPTMKITIINALPMIREVYEMTGLGKIFTFK